MDYFESLIELAEQDILNLDYRDYDRCDRNNDPYYDWDNPWNDVWFDEPTIADYERWDREYQEMCEDKPWMDIDCSNIPGGKLESFIKDTNTYKHFDKSVGGMDPYDRYRNKFCEWKSYRNSVNHIDNLLDSYVKDFASVDLIISKLKSSPKYKHNHTHKKAVDTFIDSMIDFDQDWWDYWNRRKHYTIVDGIVWRKDKMFRYLGYGYAPYTYFYPGRVYSKIHYVEI